MMTTSVMFTFVAISSWLTGKAELGVLSAALRPSQ